MEQLAEQLKAVLATAFSMYLKAHNYHWNVTGPNFSEYHKFFGEVYDQIHSDIDSYAEHIRTLDAYAPGSLVRFAELTRIQDETNIPSPMNMIMRLEADNMILRNELYTAHAFAEAAGQRGIVNFIEDRIDAHDKLAWMLKSFRGQ